MTRQIRARAYDDGRDRWQMVDAAPDARLTPWAHCYGWWSEQTASFDTRRELAATSGTLIVNLASDLELVDARGTHHRLRAGEGFIAGAALATSLSRSTGPAGGVYIRAPLTVLARLAGTPVADLTNNVCTFSDLPEVRALHLGDRLLDAGSAEQRWAALDAFVTSRLAATPEADARIAFLLRGLACGERVETLADGLSWSRKRLAQHFRDATAMHPRTFAGLARFERFTGLLQAEPTIALAEAAIAAGYADQPHLTREAVRFAAMTPAELRRRLLPSGGGVRD
ncbi:MAG TPA: helix-turn-helix domain-containing protein [Sphingomonas sp.]|nr:helix-turn-helix domain-containing protein [Sphingomonas sp.]